MEHPSLSFLMNLSGNNAVSLSGEAPGLLKESSDSGAFNAFFTSQAGFTTNDAFGAEGDIQALMNSASSGFFGNFDLAGNGFGVDAPEDLTINSEMDAASDDVGAETTLAQHGFDRRLRGGVSDGVVGQIDRLDTPNRSEHVRGRMRPDPSIGLRAVKNDAQLITKHAEFTPVDGKNPELPAITEEQNDIGAIKNRASADVLAISQQRFAPVPNGELRFDKATNGLALQFGQPPARNIEPKPELSIEAKPAHNINLPQDQAQSFDVAALAALGQVRTRQVPEPSIEMPIGDKVRESNLLLPNSNAVLETAPAASTAILAQSNEAKRQMAPVNSEVLLDVESADPARDEQRVFEPRLASRSETGGTASAFSTSPPVTTSAFAAASVVAKQFAPDESYDASMVDRGDLAQSNLRGERAPVQFAPPTTSPPAGAAWAQVISAISQRNGEPKLELRLNPPELGRVTIAFESEGAEIVRAVVSADSQQTLDLMRRNIDILQRELARAGLDNVNVELADRDAHSQSHDDASEKTVAYASIDEAPTQLNKNITIVPSIADGRLDLRV